MCLAYVGDDAIIRFGYVYQFFDVSRMAGTHFYDAEFMFRFQAQQSKGDTDVVVQVSQRIKYIIGLRKDSGHQLFGSGFPIGACDADEAGAQLAAMVIGKLLQCVQAIVY